MNITVIQIPEDVTGFKFNNTIYDRTYRKTLKVLSQPWINPYFQTCFYSPYLNLESIFDKKAGR